jgi:hypothetical protein
MLSGEEFIFIESFWFKYFKEFRLFVYAGFNFKLNFYHVNTWQDVDDDFPKSDDNFLLCLYYSSLMVEERIETFVYDFGNFLAAAGGNLSLSLGFSCLSALLAFVRYLKQRLDQLGQGDEV